MARSSAEITVKGNNVIDVELKFTKNGSGMLKLRLAVERWRKQRETWEKTNTSFVNVQLWGELAEKTAEIVEKGMRCQVTGYLEERAWETDAGEKRYSTQVVGNDVLIPVEDIETMERVQRKKRDDGDDRPNVVMNKTAAPAASDPFDEELDF